MRKLALCLMLLASCVIYAQNTPPTLHTVKGILLDSLTQEGEPYATIRIVRKEAPANAVKMAVTDTKGKFDEKISGTGDFVITITSVGRTPVVREFTLKSEDKMLDLGILYTTDAVNQLQGVEVIVQKPLVKVDLDKIEYSIEDDPDSKTNSVLEMLRKVPMVTVDGEDKIQVNGSSSFKVHVNGKPNTMMSNNPTEVLKSMPANTIKYIEVITSPGAKYDAEGVGGILNIVTVGSGFEGYTATFNISASNTGLGGGAYATVKKDKLTMTGNYSYNYGNYPRFYMGSIRENTQDNTRLFNVGSSKNKGSFQHGSMEASYELDTLRLISMSFGMYGGGNDNDNDSKVWMERAIADTAYSYQILTNGESSWYSIRGNVDYQRSFSKKGRMLTFSYNINTRPQRSDSYMGYKNRRGDDAQLSFLKLHDLHIDGEQNTTEHTFQVDYTTPIGKLHTIETGLKYIIRNNISDNDRYTKTGEEYILDQANSSHYKHLNDILAAYGGYSIKYKSFSGKTGLRYERTMQDIKFKGQPEKNFDIDFNDLVPSATLGFKIGKTQNLRVNYNMRIWRPSIYFLNPYRDDSNPVNIRQGNPGLKSEKSHSLSMNYSSFTTKFNLNFSLQHSFNNNGIEQVTTLMKDNSGNEFLYSTYENIGKSSNSGLSGYVNWNASPKTRIYMNMYGGYNVWKRPGKGKYTEELKNTGWRGFVYGGIQQTFPWELKASLNVTGVTPRTTLQGRESSYFDYSMNVNRSFLDKRLTISVYAGNIFKKYRTYSDITKGAGFMMNSSYRYSQQRFGVNISYRIGELKAGVKKAARTINNDDVKGGEGGSNGGGNAN